MTWIRVCAVAALLLCVAWWGSDALGDGCPNVSPVLDDFHDAASKADASRYFGHLTDDAVFLGTDATERWPKAAFRAFATPYFEKGRGWTYVSQSRNVTFDKTKRVAWFDELLSNEHYGTCRGSGVMRCEDGCWRIAQYNLSIPIPNALAKEVVARIRSQAPPPEPAAPTAPAEKVATRLVYIVRHAEKGAGDDPDLIAAGRARAEHLARVLRSTAIQAVYATRYKRTQQTATPTASLFGLTIEKEDDTAKLAAALRDRKAPGPVLVAGHSDTVPDLLKRLGVSRPVSIGHGDFDNLFVVALTKGQPTRMEWLHYGN